MADVWILDDEELVREFVTRALTKKQHDVLSFPAGEPFLAGLDTVRPDMVIVDLMLPGMHGFEVIKKVRERFNKETLPIMVLSASGSQRDTAEAMKLGANDYLQKPPRLHDLYARVETLCARAQPALPMMGPYKILEQLGAGGMAQVYRAIDTELGMPVALKVMHAELRRDIAFQERFRKEADILMSVHHPNVVRFHGIVDTDHGDLVLVMEHLDGGAADTVRLNMNGALRMTTDVLCGLDHLHSLNLVHRDITPGNVIVTRSGATKIVDFGIAIERAADERKTAHGAVIGSPRYLSPERFRGEVHVSTDAYALACVLFEVLEDRSPYDSKEPEALFAAKQSALPPLSDAVKDRCTDGAALEKLLREMTHPKAKKRPTDLMGLADHFTMLME